MPKFRKKPVEIEAWQHSMDPAPEWILNAIEVGIIQPGAPPVSPLIIKTLEGNMASNPGDWIIKGVKGELYPVKNDIFLQTYEPV